MRTNYELIPLEEEQPLSGSVSMVVVNVTEVLKCGSKRVHEGLCGTFQWDGNKFCVTDYKNYAFQDLDAVPYLINDKLKEAAESLR